MTQDAMTLDKADMRKLARLAARFPKETRKGMGRAGSTLRAKLRKVMRVGGGIEGVPKFDPRDPDTVELGELKNNFSNKLGGKLAVSSAIQMFNKTRGGFTIGFLSSLEPYARAFQSAETRVLAGGELKFFRVADVYSDFYHRPARPVIAPFERGAKADLVKWALRNTEKILKKAK